ncbi:Ca-activated chloride channel family protein [Micrococcales bacterium KH10]|nr:Ca-activated chloride channel family protein [Micrococcales bacterium KH10]
MTFQPIFPVAVTVTIVILFAAACFWGWRRTAKTSQSRFATLRWAGRFLLVLLVAVMTLGPSVPRDEVDTYSSGVEIYFVVDRTGSMAAEDYRVSDGEDEIITTRLDGVRSDIREIVEAYVGARFSIISFDSVASQQLPLSSDSRAVIAWADTVRQEQTMYSQGSLVDRPLNALTRALQDSIEDNPEHERLVYFFSDGENTAEGTPMSFSGLADAVDGGAVLGYGTAEGGRMQVYDPSGVESGYITDPTQEGEPEAVSVLDEESLRGIAGQLAIDYVLRDGTASLADSLGAVDPDFAVISTQRTVTVYQLMLWPFALLALVLVVFDLAGAGGRIARPVGVVTRGDV